jgi:hypothetical protein
MAKLWHNGTGSRLAAESLFAPLGIKPKQMVPLNLIDAADKMKKDEVDAVVRIGGKPISGADKMQAINGNLRLLEIRFSDAACVAAHQRSEHRDRRAGLAGTVVYSGRPRGIVAQPKLCGRSRTALSVSLDGGHSLGAGSWAVPLYALQALKAQHPYRDFQPLAIGCQPRLRRWCGARRGQNGAGHRTDGGGAASGPDGSWAAATKSRAAASRKPAGADNVAWAVNGGTRFGREARRAGRTLLHGG